MVSSTDVFAFRAKLNKIMIGLCESKLTKEQKDIGISYLTQVIDAAEQTLRT